MFKCWLCGEELAIGTTQCLECAAIQEPPWDPPKDASQFVDAPRDKTPPKVSVFTAA